MEFVLQVCPVLPAVAVVRHDDDDLLAAAVMSNIHIHMGIWSRRWPCLTSRPLLGSAESMNGLDSLLNKVLKM